MSNHTNSEQATSFYSAVYNALTEPGDMKVYIDSDNDYRVATTNVYGNHVRLIEWPSLDAYVPNGDIDEMDKNEFVSMCVECYGIDVPTYSGRNGFNIQ